MVISVNLKLANAVPVFRVAAVDAVPLVKDEPKVEVFASRCAHWKVEKFTLR